MTLLNFVRASAFVCAAACLIAAMAVRVSARSRDEAKAMNGRRARAALFLSMLAAAIFAAASAGAQKAVTYETAFDASGEGESRNLGVTFHDASCGDECYAASLNCGGDQDISFVFADVAADIAAAAIKSESRAFTVKAGASSQSFSITKVSYGGEMNDTWDVEGEMSAGGAASFAAALGKAKQFKATLGKKSITLPVTADVVKWAKVCVK
jgi:hypothetical protein